MCRCILLVHAPLFNGTSVGEQKKADADSVYRAKLTSGAEAQFLLSNLSARVNSCPSRFTCLSRFTSLSQFTRDRRFVNNLRSLEGPLLHGGTRFLHFWGTRFLAFFRNSDVVHFPIDRDGRFSAICSTGCCFRNIRRWRMGGALLRT